MESVTARLWSRRMADELQRDTVFAQMLPQSAITAAEPRTLTKRERLAQIIADHMGYDGDPEAAADAVLEFMGAAS